MADFENVFETARDAAEVKIIDEKEKRKAKRAERTVQFEKERQDLLDSLGTTLNNAIKLLKHHGISAKATASLTDDSCLDHPEIVFYCDGPERRDHLGHLSSPKSAKAIFHYENNRLISEVTDFSFSTIRRVVPGAHAEDHVAAALKFTIESYYREHVDISLQGF